MWKSCLQVRKNDTAKSLKKVAMKVKRIVNVDSTWRTLYIKDMQKFRLTPTGITLHVFAFSGQIMQQRCFKICDQKIMSIVQAIQVYGWHMQTARRTVTITR